MCTIEEFNEKNLSNFEAEYFSEDSQFQNQTYGQALNEVFDFDRKFGKNLSSAMSTGYSRIVAWQKIKELSKLETQKRNIASWKL